MINVVWLFIEATVIRNTHISHSTTGLEVDSPHTWISYCRISDTLETGVTLNYVSEGMNLNNTVIEESGENGIVINAFWKVNLANVTVNGSNKSGISLISSGSVKLSNVSVNGSGEDGIVIRATDSSSAVNAMVLQSLISNTAGYGLQVQTRENRQPVDVQVFRNQFVNNSGGALLLEIPNYHRSDADFGVNRTVSVYRNTFTNSGKIRLDMWNNVDLYFHDNEVQGGSGGDGCMLEVDVSSGEDMPDRDVHVFTNTFHDVGGRCVAHLASLDYVFAGRFEYNQMLGNKATASVVELDSSMFNVTYNIFDNPKVDFDLKVLKQGDGSVHAEHNWWGTADIDRAGKE
jgi:hypothetical protein